MTGLVIFYHDTMNSKCPECFLVVKEEFYSRTAQMFCCDPTPDENEWFLIVEDL